MRIRRFNESKEESIFDNQEILKKYLGPISNLNLSIHYKVFKNIIAEEIYPLTSQTKNGFHDIDWIKSNFRPQGDAIEYFNNGVKTGQFLRGIIIDIIEPNLIENLSTDEQRGGRVFSKLSPDFIHILEKIEDLKLDIETEGYTVGVYLSSFPQSFYGKTNFSSDAPISLLILDGSF